MTDTTSKKTGRAPWHLWVVGVLSLLWNAMGALDYVMTETKNEAYMAKFTEEQRAFFYGLPAWVIACWAIAVWGGLLGSILLLVRRSWAAPVFLVSLVAMVLTSIHNYLLANGMEVMGGAGALVFSGVIFLIAVFLYVYARALARTGILK